MNINKWAEELTRKVYYEWKSKYNDLGSGFKLFYTPVRQNPKIVIVSYNPGGDEEDFIKENRMEFDKGNFSLEKDNFYQRTPEHHFSEKVIQFFQGNETLLKNSVAFPLIFFRSKKANKIGSQYTLNKRKEMKKFCYDKVSEILQIIRPQILLIYGLHTYDTLKKNGIINVKEIEIKRSGRRRIACVADWNGVLVFSMLHPTGARISNKEFDESKKWFFDEVNNYFSSKQKYS